jgi:2-polyprenyl-6-methoxyphenol hydroxylase-like FAD-dependent oxidoreductase
MAMLDGAELALAIVARPDDIEAAFEAYEAVMFPRAHAAASGSREVLDLCLDERAPTSLVEFFSGAFQAKRG